MEVIAELDEIKAKIHSYEFFQILRLLGKLHDDKPALGYAVKPEDDWIRLGQKPSMAFSTSTLASFSSETIPRLDVSFFGLFGPNGALPLHLTEYAIERIQYFNDDSLSRFVDIFHHRLLTFFYRTWADSKPHINMEQGQRDIFIHKVASLFGMRDEIFKQKRSSADLAMCHYVGRLAQQTRNSEGLMALLNGFFKIPICLHEFIGSWIAIEPDDQFHLGGMSFGELGVDTTMGERVWQCHSNFRLRLGPLTLNEYIRFLPGNESLVRLRQLVRHYLGDEYDWDVQLILNKEQVRPARLGEFGRLGWTSWMYGEESNDHFDELLVSPQQEIL